MTLRVVSPPPVGVGLITLDEAKAHLRVDFVDDDELIGAYILAASAQVEAYTQRRYLPQLLEWGRECWGTHMVLPVAPGGDVQGIEIDEIRYADLNGDTQVLDTSIYWSRPHGATLKVALRWYQIWPWLGDAPERVTIAFRVNDKSTIPPAVVGACKMLVSHYYRNRDAVVGVDNRDSSTELPLGVQALLFAEMWSS